MTRARRGEASFARNASIDGLGTAWPQDREHPRKWHKSHGLRPRFRVARELLQIIIDIHMGSTIGGFAWLRGVGHSGLGRRLDYGT